MGVFKWLFGNKQDGMSSKTAPAKDLGLLKIKGAYLMMGVKNGATSPCEKDLVLMTSQSSVGDISSVPIHGRFFSKEMAMKFLPENTTERTIPLDARHKSLLTRDQFFLLGTFQKACVIAGDHLLRQDGFAGDSMNVFDLWHGIDPASGEFMCLIGFHDYTIYERSRITIPT